MFCCSIFNSQSTKQVSALAEGTMTHQLHVPHLQGVPTSHFSQELQVMSMMTTKGPSKTTNMMILICLPYSKESFG